MNRLVPDDTRLYTHTAEGPDDMPAHVKSSLLGCQLTVPSTYTAPCTTMLLTLPVLAAVTAGSLNLGTWQGLYLNEHRDHGGSRHIVVRAFSTFCNQTSLPPLPPPHTLHPRNAICR